MSTHTECLNMIMQQLRTGGVLDETILDLYRTISRDEFVPSQYKQFAYSDMHIKLAHNQCMMTPLEEARLLQSLSLQGNEVVLEVGTGTGFFTSLLSRLVKEVISLDYFPEFTNKAREHLEKYNCQNVTLITGDACRGWLDKAPYDVMIFTGAIDEITETHRLQLLPGGKLFVILGSAPIMEGQLHRLDHDSKWDAELIFETCIPPLIDKLKPKEFVF